VPTNFDIYVLIVHVSGITLIRNAQSQTIGKPNDKTVSVSRIRKLLLRIAEIVQCHLCLMEGNIMFLEYASSGMLNAKIMETK
jgi:hypothetical protein